MPQAHIIGTGSAAPPRALSNRDLEEIVDTNDEWITRRTGMKERRVCMPGASPADSTEMAVAAARAALDSAGVSPDQLDMIAVGSVTPDRQFPSTACMLQHELGAPQVAAFDLSAGCSGFVYALATVHNAIRCGASKTALVLGVERLSSLVNWQDRGTCVLLGDAAGALLVRASDEPGGILSTHLKADGSAAELLYSEYREGPYCPENLAGLDQKPYYLIMEGNKLFKRAVPCLAEIAQEALDHNGLTLADIDLVVPHQANIRIIEGVAKRMGIPMEMVYTNVHKYGNTSSASIPLALDEARREGRLNKGDKVLLATFGAGLTWGSAALEWTM